MSHSKYSIHRKQLREEAIKNGICVNCQLRPATHGQRCKKCKITHAQCDRRLQQADKQACMLHYGNGKAECACCKKKELKFLTMDHINNDGHIHRKQTNAHGGQIYSWLRKNGFPPGYRVLCLNCNSGRVHGLCPHHPDFVHLLDTRYKRYNLRIRIEVLTHYSTDPPKCAHCPEDNIRFLTLDHINGGGSKHRRGINCTLYKWIRRHNYPSGYQVLCFNCNLAKGFSHECACESPSPSQGH